MFLTALILLFHILMVKIIETMDVGMVVDECVDLVVAAAVAVVLVLLEGIVEEPSVIEVLRMKILKL